MATATLVELTLPECFDLIGVRGVGRLAFDNGTGPVILPVNYTFHGGVIHMRSGDDSKLAAAEERAPAAFEVDVIDEDRAEGWSVVIRGRLKRMLAPEGVGYIEEPQPTAAGDRPHLIGLVPSSVTGRELHPVGVPARRPATPEGNLWYGRDGDDLLG